MRELARLELCTDPDVESQLARPLSPAEEPRPGPFSASSYLRQTPLVGVGDLAT